LKKSIFLIGVSLGLLLTFLRALDYFVLVHSFAFEYYAAAIAAIFLGMGIWAGYRLSYKKHGQASHYISAPAAEAQGLSERELEVLLELTNGLSNKEIANKLFVSLNTVKTHISSIYLKLHVKRRTQAVSQAKGLKIIS